MKMATVVVGTLLVALTVIHTVTALQCYECIKCNDPFHSKGVKISECSGGCVKQKAETIGRIAGEDIKEGDVLRLCAQMKDEAECKEKEIDGVEVEHCFCDKELCNGSNALEVSIATGIMAIAAAALKLFL